MKRLAAAVAVATLVLVAGGAAAVILSDNAEAKCPPQSHRPGGCQTPPPTSTGPPPTTTEPPPTTTGFPDASNTGVPAGTVLTAYTGPSTVTVNNTVIDGKEAGCLTIKATNVTIRNSYVHGNGCAILVPEDPAVCVATTGGGPCTVTVTDSRLSCNGAGGTAVYYRDYTVIRADISGCENGFDASANATVRDSYIHDLWQGTGAHTDGMQLSGGHVNHAFNVTLEHNQFTGLDNTGSTINADLISNGGNGDTNIVLNNNLLGGGGYTVYCPGWQSGGTPGPGDRVTNNHWKNNFTFGHSVGCDDPALTVSGNVDYPAGNPINLG